MKKRLVLVLSVVALLCVVQIFGCPRIGPSPSDYSYPVAGDYFVVRSHGASVEITPETRSPSTPFIPNYILEVAWDDRFVLAKRLDMADQDLNGDVFPRLENAKLDWWILDTSGPVRYGPLDEATFQLKREELKVPASLQLMPVETYKPKEWFERWPFK
jgi:hypothetical protein